MEIWQITRQQTVFAGLGNQELLNVPAQAFFSSRQCPGVAIRASMAWALEQARSQRPVVSGFHSPLELSVLRVLLTAHSPVVAVLARPVLGAKLSPEWVEPLTQGRMVVISAATRNSRLTEKLAKLRNGWTAQLASQIVVAHASPGGHLDSLCHDWQQQGRALTRLG